VICAICAEGPLDVLLELSASWLTAPVAAPLPGYVCVVAKSHGPEPFDLGNDERATFWEDCVLVGRGLSGLLRPRKLNYEIHGNTIEHLHMHVYPRYVGDPFEGRPIDLRRLSFSRTGDELERLREAVEASSLVRR
jgi:diadenosine tetraphosphate (Ap4A) HIT family hydrolase